jgi:site-specific recombinase XerD
MLLLEAAWMRKTSQKRHHFVSSNEKAKSKIIARFVQIARKDRLSYDDFLYVCQQARRKLDLRRPKRERKLPQLLAEVDLKRFFRVIQDCGYVEHEIMLKFLFFTAVRVSELVKIKVGEVDLGSCKVFIGQGKGAKDRYILFPSQLSADIEESLAGKSQKPIPVRNKPPWTFYSSADPADRTELSGAGGDHSTGTSPSIPPSDDYVPHLTGSIGCTDPTDLRP